MPIAKPLPGPDILKAFGIALVVIGHLVRGLQGAGILPQEEPWISIDRLIYLFHMPLFFYAAGLFVRPMYDKYGYAGLVRRSAVVLLVPLVVWSYLQFSLQYLAGDNTNSKYGLFDVLTAPFPPRQQFWFLFVLFVLTATVPLLFKMHNSCKAICVLMSVSFLVQAALWNNIVRLMGLDLWMFLFLQTFVHLPFFLLGIVFNTEKIKSCRFPAAGAFFVFILSLAAYQFLSGFTGFVHTITSVLCVLAAYTISLHIGEKFEGKKPLSVVLFIGMNSMIIYLAHVICMAGFRVVLMKIGVYDPALHLVGGFLSGLLLPVFLVPIGAWWANRQPTLAHAILPVRLERT